MEEITDAVVLLETLRSWGRVEILKSEVSGFVYLRAHHHYGKQCYTNELTFSEVEHFFGFHKRRIQGHIVSARTESQASGRLFRSVHRTLLC